MKYGDTVCRILPDRLLLHHPRILSIMTLLCHTWNATMTPDLETIWKVNPQNLFDPSYFATVFRGSLGT